MHICIATNSCFLQTKSIPPFEITFELSVFQVWSFQWSSQEQIRLAFVSFSCRCRVRLNYRFDRKQSSGYQTLADAIKVARPPAKFAAPPAHRRGDNLPVNSAPNPQNLATAEFQSTKVDDNLRQTIKTKKQKFESGPHHRHVTHFQSFHWLQASPLAGSLLFD